MGNKKKRNKLNPKVIRTCLLLMFIFIAELLFYTWCRVQYVHTKFEIAAQTARARQLSTMHDNLKIELARLRSPRRITKIAETQLGLITPTSKQTILIP
jgi:cell division protein FtsL